MIFLNLDNINITKTHVAVGSSLVPYPLLFAFNTMFHRAQLIRSAGEKLSLSIAKKPLCGMIPGFLSLALSRSILFTIKDQVDFLFKGKEYSQYSKNIIVGGIKGAISSLFTVPFDFMKVRMQIQGGGIKQHGLDFLQLGTMSKMQLYSLSGLRSGVGNAAWLSARTIYDRHVSDDKGQMNLMLKGGFATCVSICSIMPIDLAKCLMINNRESLHKVLLQRGLKGVYGPGVFSIIATQKAVQSSIFEVINGSVSTWLQIDPH